MLILQHIMCQWMIGDPEAREAGEADEAVL